MKVNISTDDKERVDIMLSSSVLEFKLVMDREEVLGCGDVVKRFYKIKHRIYHKR